MTVIIKDIKGTEVVLRNVTKIENYITEFRITQKSVGYKTVCNLSDLITIIE
jgi:hypothetical protein